MRPVLTAIGAVLLASGFGNLLLAVPPSATTGSTDINGPRQQPGGGPGPARTLGKIGWRGNGGFGIT